MDKNWINQIINDIAFIADIEKQRTIWSKNKLEYSESFEGLIERLYDGGDFDFLIEHFKNKNTINAKLILLLIKLRDKLEKYEHKTDIYDHTIPSLKVDEQKVLRDPEWQEIQMLAGKVMQSLQS